MSYIKGYKKDFKEWLKKCRIQTFKLANKRLRSQSQEKGFYLRPSNYPHNRFIKGSIPISTEP